MLYLVTYMKSKPVKILSPLLVAIRQKIRLRAGHELQATSYKLQAPNKGFTLLEVVVAAGIFAASMTILIGIITSVINAQRKIEHIQSVQDNIRFALELMTKELRMGEEFTLSTPCGSSGSAILFKTFFNPDNVEQRRLYYLDTTNRAIRRIVTSDAATLITGADCAGAQFFTASDLAVERFSFQVSGNDPARGVRDGQPIVTIALSVHSTDPKVILNSQMDLQTTVTQRLRDLTLP